MTVAECRFHAIWPILVAAVVGYGGLSVRIRTTSRVNE
jgi:hypothetical protein